MALKLLFFLVIILLVSVEEQSSECSPCLWQASTMDLKEIMSTITDAPCPSIPRCLHGWQALPSGVHGGSRSGAPAAGGGMLLKPDLGRDWWGCWGPEDSARSWWACRALADPATPAIVGRFAFRLVSRLGFEGTLLLYKMIPLHLFELRDPLG